MGSKKRLARFPKIVNYRSDYLGNLMFLNLAYSLSKLRFSGKLSGDSSLTETFYCLNMGSKKRLARFPRIVNYRSDYLRNLMFLKLAYSLSKLRFSGKLSGDSYSAETFYCLNRNLKLLK